MISADKAAKLSKKASNRVFTTKKEVSDHIKLMVELGYCNSYFRLSKSICGNVIQELIDKNYRVFADINHSKEVVEVDLEWT